jgi:hypothetical protein
LGLALFHDVYEAFLHLFLERLSFVLDDYFERSTYEARKLKT